VPDIGSNVHFGGLATPRVLEPGGVFEDEIDLSKWFAFEEKGSYEVLGSYEIDVPRSRQRNAQADLDGLHIERICHPSRLTRKPTYFRQRA
jgi:hypothetical protein